MIGKQGLLSPQYRSISVAIYLGTALVAFEGTAVAAALPQLATDLGRIDLLAWVITAYLFSSGLSTVVSGSLVDALGSRRVFTVATAVFAVSGFLAGLVGNIFVLIAFRLVQGAASGALFAAVIAAVNLAYPSALTARAFAANSTIWGLMGAAAPAIAALLLNIASWRWIFFVNLPLGFLCFLSGRGSFPERQEGAEPPSVDWVGAALAGVVTLGLILAVDELGYRSLVMVGVVAVAGFLFVIRARHSPQPVLRLEHIAGHPYRALGLTTSLMVASAFASNIYITLYVSAGRGWSAGSAAWAVLFFVLGWTAGANTSSFLQARLSEVDLMTLGLGIGILGASLTAFFAMTDGSVVGIFAGLSLSGVGIGSTSNASLTILRAATEPRLIGRAGAAYQFVRNQGFTVGSAAGGAILLLVVGNKLGSVEPVQRLLAGDDLAAGPAVAKAVRDGFGVVSVVSLVVMVLAVIPLLELRRSPPTGENQTRSYVGEEAR